MPNFSAVQTATSLNRAATARVESNHRQKSETGSGAPGGGMLEGPAPSMSSSSSCVHSRHDRHSRHIGLKWRALWARALSSSVSKGRGQELQRGQANAGAVCDAQHITSVWYRAGPAHLQAVKAVCHAAAGAPCRLLQLRRQLLLVARRLAGSALRRTHGRLRLALGAHVCRRWQAPEGEGEVTDGLATALLPTSIAPPCHCTLTQCDCTPHNTTAPQPHTHPSQYRADPDLAPPWWPSHRAASHSAAGQEAPNVHQWKRGG